MVNVIDPSTMAEEEIDDLADHKGGNQNKEAGLKTTEGLDNTRVFWWMTLIYVGLVAALSAFAIGWWLSGRINGIGEIVDQIKLNSLGDFIAGIISPLALLWLIATVRLQSKELALQRQEIAANRKVMVDQAKAADEQAKAANEQTNLMWTQSNALREQIKLQQDVAQANYRVTLFQERFALYVFFTNAMENWDGEELTLERAEEIARHATKIEFVYGVQLYNDLKPVLDELVSWDAACRALMYFEDRENNNQSEFLKNEIDQSKKMMQQAKRSVLTQWIENDIDIRMKRAMSINMDIGSTDNQQYKLDI
ncbi:hypothetical protein M2267_001043 [Ensifer sp. KUDG1]|uniref:hypothetical protein n=1 Tax=Ensifer sp. KUDG1 TaxID=3373919 RepID=UPI003D1EF63C